MKKKSIIILVAIVAVLVIAIGSVVSSYNGFVDKREAVENAYAQINTQLQRRADLIPNFVETVKGYSDYEQETFTAVTEARSNVKNADSVSEQAIASEQLDSAISVWVNAVTEAYPDLEASQQYRDLTTNLEGTENRIATARKDYNEAVKEYNSSIRKFPGVIIASLFDFDTADYFEANATASEVPEIVFD